MTVTPAIPRTPGPDHRAGACLRPDGPPVMFQKWRDLLFLHWEYPAAEIQRTLPDGLHVDLFDGRAWLGVVPFLMRDIRPRWLPAVPGLSNFLELNLRTYVHDRSGIPGVWFYSLECNQPLAVAIARRWFHLSYQHAAMHVEARADGTVCYRSRRRGNPGLECAFEYATGEALPPAAPGSIEYFLVERYRLYAQGRGRLWRGAVYHTPYPLMRANVGACNEHLLALNGLNPTGRPPDHVVRASGVDVSVFPLRPV